MLVFADYGLTVLELGLGNYGAAFATASTNFRNNPFVGFAAFPDLIEAAARSGHLGAARQAVEEFSAIAMANPTPRVRGVLACCEALLCPG